MRRLRTAPVILLLAGGLAGTAALRAQQTSVPLEGTQRELKELQSSQSGKTIGKETPAGGVPQIQIANPGAAPMERPNFQKLDRESSQKKAISKDWLVDGVNGLAKTEKSARDAHSSAKNQTEETLPEGEAGQEKERTPQSLLEVYTESQKRESAEKRERTLPAAKSGGDPMAPFLQNWLGNSPVRGKFFDEFASGAGSNAAGVVPVSGPVGAAGNDNAGTNAVSAGSFDRGNISARPSSNAPNPYLAGLEAPTVREVTQTAPLPATSSSFTNSATAPASNPTLFAPPVDTRPVDKKPLPLPSADDKKYFPQLKKF